MILLYVRNILEFKLYLFIRVFLIGLNFLLL